MSGIFEAVMLKPSFFQKKFITLNVQDISSMFRHSRVKELDLSSFDTVTVNNIKTCLRKHIFDVGYAQESI